MTFKIFILAALACTALALPNPEPEPELVKDMEAMAKRTSSADLAKTLFARACDYNGCTGLKGSSSGKYCGFCKQVKTLGDGVITDIYQVNGGTGSCCDYGVSTSCKNRWPHVSSVNENCANTDKGY